VSSCGDKEESGENWHTCSECNLDTWIGSFSGKATYFDAVMMNEITDLEITVEFMETGEDYLMTKVTVPNYYSATVSGEMTSTYSVSFAGSGTSLLGTLYSRYDRDSEYRFTGNSKKFHYKGNELVVDEVVSFEVYK
jgi:hypothetical protein